MNDIYTKLVDLYAGRELTEELDRDLEAAAAANPDLALDMSSLRTTVEALRAEPEPEFTQESYQRVLMKVYARGGQMQPHSPDPAYMQFPLPIQG